MMKLFCIVFSLGMSSCGHFKKDNEVKKTMAEKLEQVDAIGKLYLSLASQVQDNKYGWLTDTKCDGLLFNGLYSFSGGDVELYQARDNSGAWHRYPTLDCLESGESKSAISRDMFLGLFFALWKSKDLKTLEQISEYYKAHDGTMGADDGSTEGKSRVYMTPTLASTMYTLIYKLGGEDNDLRKTPEVWTKNKGFEAHLDVIHILLRGMAEGAISDFALSILKHHASRQLDNALYSAAYHKFKDGDQQKAVDILLRSDLFPQDRLPESKDRCINYLFMHDKKDSDWLPCKEKKTHSGTDFLFVREILKDESYGFALWK